MMKNFYTLILLFCFGFNAVAQVNVPGCDGTRYIEDVFPTVTKTTVTYGYNINTLGQNQELKMDVYTPDGDTLSNRPVIIWAFGGSFIVGQRADMAQHCIAFAKKGYVTATIDYRLWPLLQKGFPTGEQILGVVVQAVSDMKGSIRYFRKDADQGNQFGIDPARIIVGGYSAGSVTALHVAHLDPQDSLPPLISNAINANGGMNGNTGDSLMLTYPTDVLSCINLSGGLYEADWIDANSPAFVSYHGDADGTVPYESGIANGLLYIEGSKLLKERSDAVGVNNYFVTVPGGGHTDSYTDQKFASYFNEFWTNTFSFLEDLVCGASTSTTEPNTVKEIISSPNPANNFVKIDLPSAGNYTVEVINTIGKVNRILNVNNNKQLTIERENLPAGMYFIKINSTTSINQYVSRVVFY